MHIRILLMLALLTLLSYVQIIAQMDCGTTESFSDPTECRNWDDYYPVNESNTNIKQVKVTIHVFQKDDGSDNFQDTMPDKDWLKDVIRRVNSRGHENNEEMAIPSTSNFYSDTRIKFVLDSIYFWKDSLIWAKGYSGWSGIYSDYVSNNDSVVNKENSIHIFLFGRDLSNNGAAIPRGNYNICLGAYIRYTVSHDPWVLANLIRHELGHNLNLFHTWCEVDGCNDTPLNCNCGSTQNNGAEGYNPTTLGCDGCNASECSDPEVQSNNVMDYNSHQASFTSCQIHRMHNALLNENYGVSNALIGTVNVKTSTIIGQQKDIHSRFVLNWSISNSMDARWVSQLMEQTIQQYGPPQIINTDQGSQYTSEEFTSVVLDPRWNIKLSMDGKGRATDNAFIEALWKTVKYENIYPNPAQDGLELYQKLAEYFEQYNQQRRHSGLAKEVPAKVYHSAA